MHLTPTHLVGKELIINLHDFTYLDSTSKIDTHMYISNVYANSLSHTHTHMHSYISVLDAMQTVDSLPECEECIQIMHDITCDDVVNTPFLNVFNTRIFLKYDEPTTV